MTITQRPNPHPCGCDGLMYVGTVDDEFDVYWGQSGAYHATIEMGAHPKYPKGLRCTVMVSDLEITYPDPFAGEERNRAWNACKPFIRILADLT